MTAPKKPLLVRKSDAIRIIDWATTPNARRHRKMLHVTMSPEGIARLDEERKEMSRGEFIEWFLETMKTERQNPGT